MKLDFCPTCGQRLQQQTPTHYRCENSHDYYNNARAATAIILINDREELLFSRRARDPRQGYYDFPGGFVDFGESAYEGAVRELKEELGIQPGQLALLTTVTNQYLELVTTVDCVYTCRSWQGEFAPADDVSALEWHSLAFMHSDQFAWTTYEPVYELMHSRLTGTA